MYNHRFVFWAACLGMLIFGITLTILGAVLPQLMTQYDVGKAQAGSLFTLMSFGLLLGSLFFGPIADRFGYKPVLIISTALIGIGLEGVAYAPVFALLYPAVAGFGIGGGMINGATNALVSDISEEARSSELAYLGIFFGIGAAGIPLIMGVLADLFPYDQITASVGGSLVLPLALYGLLTFPAPKHPQALPLRPAGTLITKKTLLLLGLVLFLESGMEITMGGWTNTFFHEEMGVPADQSAYFLALFWFGLMISRLILGSVLKRVDSSVVLQACMGLAFVASVLLLVAPTLYLAAGGIVLLGAGFAGVYPIILGYVGDIYTELSGTAFSITIAMGLIGGMLLPYATGVFGELWGLRGSLLIVPLALTCMAILVRTILHRFSTHHPEVELTTP